MMSSHLCCPRVRAKVVGWGGVGAKACKAFLPEHPLGFGFPFAMLLSRDSCLQVRMVAFLTVLDTGLGAKKKAFCAFIACRSSRGARLAGVSLQKG